METQATFRFRKLKNNEKIESGDFISTDGGQTVTPVKGNSYIGLFTADLLCLKNSETIWRVTEQIQIVDSTYWNESSSCKTAYGYSEW